MAVQSVNPATEEVWPPSRNTLSDRIDEVLDQSVKSFRDWRDRPFAERSRLMHAAAAELRRDAERFALLITQEMGKPLAQSKAEIEKCAWCCDFFADNAEGFLADIPSPSSASESYVAFDPLGTVLAIMPWNFPFWQVFRFAAPTLMAATPAFSKHASNVPQCASPSKRCSRGPGSRRACSRRC